MAFAVSHIHVLASHIIDFFQSYDRLWVIAGFHEQLRIYTTHDF